MTCIFHEFLHTSSVCGFQILLIPKQTHLLTPFSTCEHFERQTPTWGGGKELPTIGSLPLMPVKARVGGQGQRQEPELDSGLLHGLKEPNHLSHLHHLPRATSVGSRSHEPV